MKHSLLKFSLRYPLQSMEFRFPETQLIDNFGVLSTKRKDKCVLIKSCETYLNYLSSYFIIVRWVWLR